MVTAKDLAAIILLMLWYSTPAYVANGLAVILGKNSRPIDNYKVFIDGRRILGDGKTIGGFIGGIMVGFLATIIQLPFRGLILSFALETAIREGISTTVICRIPSLIAATSFSGFLMRGFLLSLGAMLGDLIGSFIKRRLGLERGAPCIPLDQLDFIIVALLIGSLVTPIPLQYILVFLAVTFIAHITANFIAYKLGAKNRFP
ncbi:CDP-2,3-bis-(O-geranylgeranyl)-sn-glycerol synthase [archaeon]|nr:MAG: CDP-2,3-bis-(O-geranylgeranyl)-sn-glycerol synthase [archaeon]RLG65280.1 MAG: CDP-2,3-bis-(O-geranylgeranyl)-sn-glycerol synthase [archaeon]